MSGEIQISFDATASAATAHLDGAHIGDIEGAFGSIAAHDHGRRDGWRCAATWRSRAGWC